MHGNRDTTRLNSSATLHHVLSQLRGQPRETWLELSREDQSRRWREGAGPPAEAYFQRLPELLENLEEALVLVCSEVHLRRERGEEPGLVEYQRRFPELADELSLQFEIDYFLGSLAEETDDVEAHSVEGFDAADTVVDIPSWELPGYELLEQIGSGAFSVVYRARQISLNRIVAVKMVDTRRLEERHRARQLREAEILAQIAHPHVVHVYEVLNISGWLYLVMEYVDGSTLAKAIAGKPLEPRRAAELMRTLSEAMEAIHAAGVVHRDLKPTNVLLTSDGVPKIADFGLARQVAADSGLTTEDAVLGTPSYMPPEQAMGSLSQMGPRSDVYSLGAVMYELLTARPPLLGATVLETLSLIRERDPVRPRQLQPSIPRDLETICLKCMEKSSDERYLGAAELSEDLRRFLDGRPILARPPGVVERLVRRTRRYPYTTAGVVTSCLMLAALAVGWWVADEREQQAAAAALVESIASADIQLVPRLIDRLPDHEDRVGPLLDRALEYGAPQSAEWLNLALADVALGNRRMGAALVDYLPAARPEEVLLVVRILTEQQVEVPPQVWAQLTDEAVGDEARLRLACLVAQVNTSDSRWEAFAVPVARALARQHPLDVQPLATALRPAREALIPALLELARDDELDPTAQTAAAGVLARFAPDKPKILAELIVDGNLEQFRVLLPALARHTEAAVPWLQKVVESDIDIATLIERGGWQTPHDIERTYDALQRRRAVAAVALWQLGQPETALTALAQPEESAALRAWIVELMGPLEVSSSQLRQTLFATADAATRQALVLAIGQVDLEQLSPADRETLVSQIAQLYAHDPDPGVHSACGWLWRLHLKAGELPSPAIPNGPIQKRRWFEGPRGHTFVVVQRPGELQLGSPAEELWRDPDEVRHAAALPYSYAVSMHEVTIAQFAAFDDAWGNRRYSPTPDCPMNNVSWFDAAKYCRWLSEQDGVAEDQMCYPPLEEIGPEMMLADNWHSRVGYRLPTPAEWEAACRAGVPDSRYFGEGDALFDRYAVALPESDDRAWPVGSLKPNRWGLFDTLGNIGEWCQPTEADGAIRSQRGMARRGGDFGDVISNVRAARRTVAPADAKWGNTGFRVVRRIAGD